MTDEPKENSDDFNVPRSAVEIAKRAIGLHCVIAASHDVSKADLCEWLKSEGLYKELSARERRFLETQESAPREISQAAWRVEAQVALLWAIQKISDLDPLTATCKTARLVDALPPLFAATADFIESATLRQEAEIEAQYEFIYDTHCEVRTAQNTGVPTNVNLRVVQERHYAMNWITGYCGQAWDEITTDT